MKEFDRTKEIKMKKIILTIMVLAMFISITIAKEKKPGFFSTKNLYFFLEGGSIGINPTNPYDYDSLERTFSPIYGVGFTLLKLSDSGRMNFEFDFINPSYSVSLYHEPYKQKISFYSYKLNLEYILKNKKFTFFCSIGLTNIKYKENEYFYSNSLATLLIDFGVKAAILKNLFIRGEIKFLLEPDENYNYYNSYNNKSDPISNIFAIGLEFRL